MIHTDYRDSSSSGTSDARKKSMGIGIDVVGNGEQGATGIVFLAFHPLWIVLLVDNCIVLKNNSAQHLIGCVQEYWSQTGPHSY